MQTFRLREGPFLFTEIDIHVNFRYVDRQLISFDYPVEAFLWILIFPKNN